MQFNIHDVYDNTGEIKKELADSLTGHKHLFTLLPNLQLLNLHLHSNADISIHEEAQSGLYFSFLGKGPIKTTNDIDSVQIAYQAKNMSGQFTMKKNEQRSLVQIRISPAHLASVLGETEDQIIQHVTTMRDSLGDENQIIQLPFTEKSANVSEPALSHNGHSISLAGHLYAIISTLIEQLQMLSHLSQCEDCQRKLYNAQNLLEVLEHGALDISQLSQKVGLNSDALSIGFYLLVGQSIESYWAHNRIKFAAAQLRKDPTEKGMIVAQSGFSKDQFEAAFIQYFGVSSHQYSQIH